MEQLSLAYGRITAPMWLDSATVHRQVAPRREGPERYAEFVAQGKGITLWETALRAQIYLGGDVFVHRMQALADSPDVREIPCAQRRSVRLSLESYLHGSDRNDAIVRAYREGGHTQTAIAAAVG